MSMPVSPVHDININVTNSCNDCCEDGKCSCSCFGKKTPKPSPVANSAQAIQAVVRQSSFPPEEKIESPERIKRPNNLESKKKKCVIL